MTADRYEGASADGITAWMGLRWDDPTTARVTIRPELLNPGGLLSGSVTFTLVDYTMASALIEHLTEDEALATLNVALTWLRTARDGDVLCRTTLDRRTRTNAALRSEVTTEDGTLLATAVGTYAIFPRRR